MFHLETATRIVPAVKHDPEREARYELALQFVRKIEARLKYRRLLDTTGQELFTVTDVVNAVVEGRWANGNHSAKNEVPLCTEK